MATGRRGRKRPDIAAQHRELRQMLSEIEATNDLGRLVTVLEDLRSELRLHFADEEREDGGLAEAVGASAPRHMRRLDQLLAEHAQLLQEADRLITRGRTLLDGAVRDIQQEALALSEHLRRHEAQETELLSDAVYADIGGG
jgi:hypothetical protein